MKKKEYRIKFNPNKLKVRDELIKEMITSNGGVVRVFKDKKKAEKADKTKRKAKYKNYE